MVRHEAGVAVAHYHLADDVNAVIWNGKLSVRERREIRERKIEEKGEWGLWEKPSGKVLSKCMIFSAYPSVWSRRAQLCSSVVGSGNDQGGCSCGAGSGSKPLMIWCIRATVSVFYSSQDNATGGIFPVWPCIRPRPPPQTPSSS